MAAIFWLMILVPVVWSVITDPAPGFGRSKAASRNLACEQLNEDAVRRRYPGTLEEVSSRGDFVDIRTMACGARIMAYDERPVRDGLLLTALQERAADIAQKVIAQPDAAGRTWLVEAFYPDPKVATKLAFAVKAALVERQQKVSDRVPTLAAGDVLVLGATPPVRAYPLACARYQAEGSLAADDTLLMITLTDPRDVTLSVGRCTAGEWQWI